MEGLIPALSGGQGGVLKSQSLDGLGIMASTTLNYIDPDDAIIIGAPDDEFTGKVGFFYGYLLPRDFPPNDENFHSIDTVKLMVMDSDQGTVQVLPVMARMSDSSLDFQYDFDAGSIDSGITSINRTAYFVGVDI